MDGYLSSEEEKLNRLTQLAQEVMLLSRNTLLVQLRFMDQAVHRLALCPVENAKYIVDGRRIVFGPVHVLRGYGAEKEGIARAYLHMILHCVFRHFLADPETDAEGWDLACDITVENIICELGLACCRTKKEALELPELAFLRTRVKYMTAEHLYRYLCGPELSPAQFERYAELFSADDHSSWHPDRDKKEDSDSGAGGSSGEKEQSAESMQPDELLEDWQEISEKMQVDLETFSRRYGERAGGLVQNLKAINREKYDYERFLRRFSANGEVMKTDDDEFDYIFYTYGLKLYGNMPLIEPLEYKEVKKIRDFVIAIDTSASTSGELVRRFVQKTYNILKSGENFFRKIDLHIVQCDKEIQEHVKLRSQAEFDDYIKTMSVKGQGGTDFRPVFRLVDELREAGEFSNFKGLIYFTDGFGIFPEKKPDYQTACVFVSDGNEIPQVPSWVIRLVLDPEEI